MRTELLTARVTPFESPDKAERGVLEIFCVFQPIQVVFVIGEPFCDAGFPS